MTWLFIFALLGFNALSYSAIVAFVYRSDRLPDRHPKLRSRALPLLFILSLPGSIVFESAFRVNSNHFYDLHMKDMRALRAVAEKVGKPPAWEAEAYSWDVDSFTDKYGDFDLLSWKSHEYSKLGL